VAPVDSASGPRIVVLAGPGDSTNIVVHYLAARYGDVVVVQERPQSRWTLARRRARRLGWVTVTGQVLFVAVVMPVLRRRGRARIASVLAESQLDPSPVGAVRSVSSVNAPEAAALLGSLHPDVVVVNGTRIIGAATLNAIACPVVNVHAGITPRYRGVHGGYWALAEGRPDLVGTTVHLVDTGIDTGRVLDRGFFHPGPADSIATYPYLHLACGLPLLAGVVDRLIGTDAASPGQAGTGEAEPGESTLRWHPTVWGYVWRRMRRGVR
jgi:folate-dependent phosphoribosylglycinamide formyltransferase PurN